MKFGDKLVELRKKNGYSQEELAEKLGVSRQSVSKWESNNTYPETDKIVQIANIFDCSMDDLINDKVTDVESTLRKNKNNIYNIWDSLLEFITKTINMFSKMNFATGFKCIIEMIILGFLLWLFGQIVCSTASSVIANIFSFLNHKTVSVIREILDAVFNLIWFIVAAIAIIHTFKLRYLNKYISEEENNIKNNKKDNLEENSEVVDNNNINEKKKEKEIKEEEKPFAFLGVLSKIVIFFIKFLAFWLLVGATFITVGLVVSAVIALAYIPTNIIFLWISLFLIAAAVISVQISILLISFIFNKKFNFKVQLITFISSVIVFGICIGMTFLSFKNIEFIDDNSLFDIKTKEITFEYKDDLVINSNGLGVSNKYQYVIDNTIENNKIIVSRELDDRYFKLIKYKTRMDMMPVMMIEEESKDNFKIYYDLFIENIKKNKIYTFDNYGNDPLVIKANEETITKLLGNLRKLYLFEENVNGNVINVTISEEKVYFRYGVEGSYDARTDTIKYNDGVENYSCKKEIESTQYGEKIIYLCDYKEKVED